MRRAYLDLGTNLDRESNLRRALAALGREFGGLRTSAVFESPAVGGGEEQPAFFNLAVELRTELSAAELGLRLRALEDELGRVRGPDKYAPRPIDLDLIWLEGESEAHPQLATQAFVLVPMCELAPGLVHPRLGKPLWQLLAEIAIPEGLRRVGPVEQL